MSHAWFMNYELSFALRQVEAPPPFDNRARKITQTQQRQLGGPTRCVQDTGSPELEWVPVVLDFGLTKRLPSKARRGLCKWVSAVEAMDGERMKVAFEEIGAWQDTHTCMCSATVNTNARIENVGR